MSETDGAGRAMMALARALQPFPRSITGHGVRATLRRLAEEIPLTVHEVPSGTPVFDWTVPPEWNVGDAWIKGPSGEVVVDRARSNLHVLNYSAPVDAVVSRDELARHVFTLPDQPDVIPYRTSYYQERWGFCMSHAQFEGLPDGEYHVYIDATIEAGSLCWGEVILPGTLDDEVLVSTHVCHPTMANDNLSGIVVAARLASLLASRERRHTFRFLFIPGTIGSISWLSRNRDRAQRVRHGLVLAGVGDPGAPHYKRSRRGTAVIDRAVSHVLESVSGAGILEFSPYGYDERQFCSPGFDLPVGCFMRTPHGEYPEYHTSADDLDFITPDALEDSLGLLLRVVEVLEQEGTYRNLSPHCEPQLGKRGLYDDVGGRRLGHEDRMAILWVLNQSDGDHSLLDIAERSGISFATLSWAASALEGAGLLERMDE